MNLVFLNSTPRTFLLHFQCELLFEQVLWCICFVNEFLLLDIEHNSFKQMTISLEHHSIALNLLFSEFTNDFLLDVKNLIFILYSFSKKLPTLRIKIDNLLLLVVLYSFLQFLFTLFQKISVAREEDSLLIGKMVSCLIHVILNIGLRAIYEFVYVFHKGLIRFLVSA